MPLPALPGFKGTNRITTESISGGVHDIRATSCQSVYILNCSDCECNVIDKTSKVSHSVVCLYVLKLLNLPNYKIGVDKIIFEYPKIYYLSIIFKDE